MEHVTTASREITAPIRPLPSGFSDVPYIGLELGIPGKNLLLLLDTGTSVTLLRESLRTDVDLRKVTEGQIEPGDGDSGKQTIYFTSSMDLDGFQLRNEPITFFSDERFEYLAQGSGTRIDGILGCSVLKRGEIEIDGPQKLLTIRPFEEGRITSLPSRVPLIFIPDSNSYAVPLESDSENQGRFLLDSGTNAALILARDSRLGKEARKTPPLSSTECRTWHGTYSVEVHSLPTALALGKYLFKSESRVFVEERSDSRLKGSIGVPIFWNCSRVVLNHEEQLAAFEVAEQ